MQVVASLGGVVKKIKIQTTPHPMDGPIRKLNRASNVRSSGNVAASAGGVGEGSSGTDTITRQHATSDPLSALLAGAGDDADATPSFPSSSSAAATAVASTPSSSSSSSSSQMSRGQPKIGTPAASRKAPAPNPRSSSVVTTPAAPTPSAGGLRHRVALRCVMLRCVALRCVALRCLSSRCVTSVHVALFST